MKYVAALWQGIGKGVRKNAQKKREKAKSQNSEKKREAMLKKWDKAFVAFAKANGIDIPKKKQRKKMWKTLFRHLGRIVGITKGAYIMAEEILSKNGLKQYRLIIIENGKEVSFNCISEEGFDRLHDQAKRIAQDLDTTKSDLSTKQGELEAAQDQLGKAKNALQAKEQELETLRKDFGEDLLACYKELPQIFRASLNLTESSPAFILGIRDKLPTVHKNMSEMAQRSHKNGQSLESQELQSLRVFIEKLWEFLGKMGYVYERIETQEGERFDTAKHIAVNDKVSGTIDKVLLQGFKKGDTLKSLVVIKE